MPVVVTHSHVWGARTLLGVAGRRAFESPRRQLQYLVYLASKLPKLDERARYESPYYDYLQAPLQPLMDNLESQTYETRARARPRP